MAWLERFTLVMRSSITTLREKVEDPERMLHQLICDMEEESEAVRRSVAEAIADEIQLRKRADRARQEAAEWDERAKSALKRGDETGARAALDQKLLAANRAESLAEEHRKQREQVDKLQASVRDLEDKVRQARQKRTLLLARLTRAESSNRINKALAATTSRSAFAQFSRLEDRIERTEALEEAHDRLEGKDPDAEELQRKFEAEARKEELQKEFEALRQRVNDET